MTLYQNNYSEVIFVLDSDGKITHTTVQSLFSGHSSGWTEIEGLQDNSFVSIFCYDIRKSIFLGHSNNRCSEIKIEYLLEYETLNFSGVQEIKV